MRPIDAMVARLIAATSATTQTVFSSNAAALPAGPGPFLTLVETGGMAPDGTHNGGPLVYRQPAFQVTARGAYPAARALADEAYVALTVTEQVWSGLRFLRVRPLQEPFELAPDDNGRARVVFNVLARVAA